MANSLNHCILIGDVFGEPDIECAGNRELVVRFTLLTENLNPGEASDRHQIVCHGHQAEAALDCARAGHKLEVVGEITYRASYVGFGESARMAEIVAHRIELLRSGPALDSAQPALLHQEQVAA